MEFAAARGAEVCGFCHDYEVRRRARGDAARQHHRTASTATPGIMASRACLPGTAASRRALSGLIGELSTRSEIFRTWWAAHNVRFHRTGVKRLHHWRAGRPPWRRLGQPRASSAPSQLSP